MLDRDMLEAYQSRWQAVNDFETLEQQQTSIALRWRQMNALFAMASALGLVMRQDETPENDVAIRRWNRLVELILANNLRPSP